MSSVRPDHTWWTCTPRERTIMQSLIKEDRHFQQTTDELLYTFNVSVPDTVSHSMSDWADWTNVELIHLLAEGMKEAGLVAISPQIRPMNTEVWHAADYALALIERTMKGFEVTGLEDLMGGVVIDKASVEGRTHGQVASYRAMAEASRQVEMATSGSGSGSLLNILPRGIPRNVPDGGIAHPAAAIGELPTRSYHFRSTTARRHTAPGVPCPDGSPRDNLEDLHLEEAESTSIE